MTAISEAVILMAGEGSRLRDSDKNILKPVAPVLGRPLISYTLEALTRAGIKTVHFVVGYESERVTAHVKQLIPSGLSASFIENRDWQKQNGISLLVAAGHVAARFVLTMTARSSVVCLILLILVSSTSRWIENSVPFSIWTMR